MKTNLLLALTTALSVSTACFAEDIVTESNIDTQEAEEIIFQDVTGEIIYNDTVYVPKRSSNSRFFMSVEAPLISYNTTNLNVDLYGEEINQDTSEFTVNKGIFDDVSLVFGFDIDNRVRLSFDIAHQNIETSIDGDNDTETDAGVYGITVDGFIDGTENVSPFVRLGLAGVFAETDDVDFSAMMIKFGAGVNYYVNDNFFLYGVASYAFIPETEIDDTDVSISADSFSVAMGMGYRF